MSIETKLKNLSIKIPSPPNPVGNYLAVNKTGNLLFVSGQLPIDEKGNLIQGKIGKDLSFEDAEVAVRLASLNVLGQLKNFLGDLDKVKKCVKITGYFNCTDDFGEHPKLLNITSDLIVKIFEEKGKHARAVIGTDSLPLNASVELDTIFEI